MLIDEEFKSQIPPLSREELELLEESLKREGCRDPLTVCRLMYETLPCKYCPGIEAEEIFLGSRELAPCDDPESDSYVEETSTCDPERQVSWVDGVWQCDECGYGLAPDELVLLDGHHRYEICTRLGIPFDTFEIDEFLTREEMADWIDANQLGRRNLTPDQMSILRGRRYNRMKRQGERTDLTSGQNGTKSTTAETLGAQHGVSERTIKRDGQFADAIEKLKQVEPGIEHEVIRGHSPAKSVVVEAAKFVETAPEEAITILRGKAHVANNSGGIEWYTPAQYIEPARQLFGGVISLDPCSSYEANQVVRAESYYTVEDDGLLFDWHGNIWMNPPYETRMVVPFVEHLSRQFECGNVKQAVTLVNNATETRWFQTLIEHASAIAFIQGRIQYWRPGQEANSPLQGQAIVYHGPYYSQFRLSYSSLGWTALL
jgi:phage N-6-adenine-methyltransferase